MRKDTVTIDLKIDFSRGRFSSLTPEMKDLSSEGGRVSCPLHSHGKDTSSVLLFRHAVIVELIRRHRRLGF